jgi:hypothetical protein
MTLFQKTAAALALAWLVLSPALAQQAVPINATFGFQWTPVDWSTPVRVTATEGAAGLPNGTVISIVTQDRLDIIEGHITSDYVILFFSPSDVLYAMYDRIPAGYDSATDMASFGGPLTVVAGEGRFLGASGNLTIRSKVLFGPLVGIFEIKGVIVTAK